MQTTLTEGQTVQLKTKAADAYGLDKNDTYTIKRLYTKPGYKALWAELEGGAMTAPFNKVKASEIR